MLCDHIHIVISNLADLDSSEWYVFGPLVSESFYHQAEIVRKKFIPNVFLLLFYFLSMKNYASNKQKNWISFFVAS